MRLAPAGEDAANNLQEARGNVMGRMKDGDTCRVHGVVPRHVVIEPREESRTGRSRCRGPLPLKKTRDRGTTHAESLTSREDTRTMDGSGDQEDPKDSPEKL